MTIYCQAPSYLQDIPWLDFELSRARELVSALKKQLKRLQKKTTVDQVHDTRVALRRWDCIWQILQADGWESAKFKQGQGRRLKRLLKVLGELRDWDVCLELGAEYSLSGSCLKAWKKNRRLACRKVSRTLAGLEVDHLDEELNTYLQKRCAKLKRRHRQTSWVYTSAFDHLIVYLRQREQLAEQLESTASTSKELHRLRLAIKNWRYFLTEIFGLTNLELVKSQQYLGKIHDLEHLEKLLSGQTEFLALTKIRSEKKQLLQEFSKLRSHLPYGLKPQEITLIS